MKSRLFKSMALMITLLFFATSTFSQSAMDKPLSGVKDTKQYKTIDLIYMDKDLSIFANLLTLSGLNTSLALTDKSHTLFVPTNDAFAEMTIERFAELTDPTNRSELIDFVNLHFVETKIESSQMTDYKVISQNNSTTIPIAVSGNQIRVGGALIGAADIQTSTGVIHTLNEVISVTK